MGERENNLNPVCFILARLNALFLSYWFEYLSTLQNFVGVNSRDFEFWTPIWIFSGHVRTLTNFFISSHSSTPYICITSTFRNAFTDARINISTAVSFILFFKYFIRMILRETKISFSSKRRQSSSFTNFQDRNENRIDDHSVLLVQYPTYFIEFIFVFLNFSSIYSCS